MLFKLVTDFSPAGSQPQAIEQLCRGIGNNFHFQTLLGVTGSGKTFTVANVIEQVQKPTLVMAHNKTLAAQLYHEFKDFFPHNRVEFFISYYDYYQPESYIPQRDLYIEKETDINEKIEQMRLSATASLSSHLDVIVVASVSCIYSVGNPEFYKSMGFEITRGQMVSRKEIQRRLIDIQYERNDMDLLPGQFRIRGDTIDIIPGYSHRLIRVEFFGDKVERIVEMEKIGLAGTVALDYYHIYPARHFVIPEGIIDSAMDSINKELDERLPQLGALEAHRLKQRTLFDLEMMRETGYCKGIENYSRHFDGRKSGDRPYCLLDYFPEDFLLVADESHQTLPQVRGMYHGDYTRKKNLIDYGFRLPSAFDNRPLRFDEFEAFMGRSRVLFTSATPAEYEREHSQQIVEQIIRPTGLVDPEVIIRPIQGQIEDLLREITRTIEEKNRILVTTLTKKMAEELTDYLIQKGFKARYLHSEIDALARNEIIQGLRLGKFDVLVGINLLREGLDIPEVAFIGVLDADKEGFLRNSTSLIQIIGRAARNIRSRVVLYAEVMTDSIQTAVNETERRRNLQIEYNRINKITPRQIVKPVRQIEATVPDVKNLPRAEIASTIPRLEKEMKTAAENLDFETAIILRDRINALKERLSNRQR